MRVFVDGPAGYQPFGYQEVLVGSREARKASDGICAVELDPVPQTFSFWVIPTEDAQAIDFGEGDRVVRKAGVGGHPLLVMPVFKVVAAFPVIPNVGIPGEDVHRDFYIALGGRIDVIFAFDGEDPVGVHGQDIHFVRNGMAGQDDACLYLITFFGKKIGNVTLERVAGVPQLADGVFQAIPYTGSSGVLAQQGEGLLVDFFGSNTIVGFQGDSPDNDLGGFVVYAHVLERAVYLHRVEWDAISRFFDYVESVRCRL